MTHICVGNLTIIGPDNGLSPGRRQAIIWTNAGILLIGSWGTNFSEILSEIHIFSFNKMHLEMLSGKCRPFCLGLNVLKNFLRLMICDTLWWWPAPAIPQNSYEALAPGNQMKTACQCCQFNAWSLCLKVSDWKHQYGEVSFHTTILFHVKTGRSLWSSNCQIFGKRLINLELFQKGLWISAP